MKNLQRKSRLEEILAGMPAGFVERVGKILESRVGRDAAISREGLADLMQRMGFGNDQAEVTLDRQVRAAISALRKQGAHICSNSGEGGYYMAADREEFDEFLEREYKGKINDMQETVDAMTATARRRWGEGYQMGLGL